MTSEIIALLDNPRFKEWVFSPNVELEHYWQNLCGDCPEKRKTVGRAVCILRAMHDQFQADQPEHDSVDRMLMKILSAK